jgi:anaerobic magnesium-protoporphyrin IX monomethyl ester cyclase
MKVILINSPLFRNKNDLYDEDSLPPIGLGYIATNLKNNGIQVELIDAVHLRIPLSDLQTILVEKRPDIVGTNVFTTNYELVKDICEGLGFPARIVVGGLSTRELYKDIIAWKTDNPIDIVTGDGERIMLDIVRGSVGDQPFFEETNRRVFRVDNLSRYLVSDISDVPLDRGFFQNEPILHPLGFTEANIITSRGCVYNCTFCAAARSLNRDYPVRERSVSSIWDELREIAQHFPAVSSIRVLDDLFLKSKDSIQKAIQVFRPFSFQWRSMAHVQSFRQVDDALMEELHRSGCKELFIGIESGSPKILDSINKTKDITVIMQNLKKAFKAGIHLKGYFIYGFPKETEEDMQMTYELAAALKELALQYGVNFRTSVFQYRPYHSTQIYHDLEAEGRTLNVARVEANQALSDLVGRLQFNFHSGNYSEVGYQIVEDYIYRTINLNGGKIFSDLDPYSSSLQRQSL